MSASSSSEIGHKEPLIDQYHSQKLRRDVASSEVSSVINPANVNATNPTNHTVTKPHNSQQLLRPSDNSNIDNLINLGDNRHSIIENCSSCETRNIEPYNNNNLASNETNNSVIEKHNTETHQRHQNHNLSLIKSRNQQQRQVRYKSLLASSTVINEGDELINNNSNLTTRNRQELIDFSNSRPTHCDIIRVTGQDQDRSSVDGDNLQSTSQDHSISQTTTFSDLTDNYVDPETRRVTSRNFFDEDEDDDQSHRTLGNRINLRTSENNSLDDSAISPSHHRVKGTRQRQQSPYIGGLLSSFRSVISNLKGKHLISSIPYHNYDSDPQDDNQPTSRRFRFQNNIPSNKRASSEKSFRGPYRFSRIGIVMALLKRLFSFLFQRSTLALFGAFLIHITLGTVYTLSNVNSYLTSYMRLHGSPTATYGGSMWISSSYAVGQGLSMVLGGYLEKRFSARLSCILGCLLHSLSIMSTSIAVNHGQLAVLVSYGLLPGFGCGLAYMTPMSNGFGWFPHKRGLVAGTILAGFGIGTFVFNMAQTAYVNPKNLSPEPNAGGYFTQESILENVPHLFVFLGSIYASMQFVGCCLLFKPPSPSPIDTMNDKAEMHDERPLLLNPDEITHSTLQDINGCSSSHPIISQLPFRKAILTREFLVLFVVFGVTNQGVLFVNSMLKEYAQLFIDDDMYLAWTGSMASIANSLGRLLWGLAIDRYSFTQCFTAITTIFGTLMFLMPFEFILSSKLLYLLCTLGVFGSFSGWMSTYPVHLSRVFGVKNSGMVYGLIFVSQSIGGIMTAFGAHYLIDHFTRFVPFFVVTFLEVLGLSVYHLFYFS